jgi:hypothetical protein
MPTPMPVIIRTDRIGQSKKTFNHREGRTRSEVDNRCADGGASCHN